MVMMQIPQAVDGRLACLPRHTLREPGLVAEEWANTQSTRKD
jgi:hypothetical protein